MKTLNFITIFMAMLVAVCTSKNLEWFRQRPNNKPNKLPAPTENEIPDYENVLKIFKQVNGVPRPSQHEEKMGYFLVDFAKEHDLEYVMDGKNVIIYKEATPGMEGTPMITLQTHQDMVCVAKDGYEIDFLEQGIESYNDGTYIRSKDNNTSLGADDGIGVSIVLAILESKTISHGPLECLFTWDEEQEFSGAIALTPGILKGKYMMNIDWETDGELCIGTAGGLDVAANLAYNITETPSGYAAYNLSVSGLTGGHSGVAIVNGGSNAIKLLGDFLATISDLRLAAIEGGSFPNVISISSKATVLVPEAQKTEFETKWETYVAEVKAKYATADPNMELTIVETETPKESMTEVQTKAVFAGLANAAQGVTEWSETVKDIFETSNNVGPITMKDGTLNIEYLVRGFNNDNIAKLADIIISGFEGSMVGFTTRKYGAFSPWNPPLDSALMNYARNIYQEHFGKPISLRKVGGGLELSEFAVVYPDMQFISYGPTVNDPHTINETVEVKTVKSTWEYTVELLRNIKQLEN
ncbi:putative aminoacyl-histidine dipeptidase [Neocallimastix sp. 'constans']